MGVTSVATALPRPRLRSERVVVDMNGLLLANAVQANAAIRATRALSDAGFVVALYAKGKAAKRGLKTRFTAWL